MPISQRAFYHGAVLAELSENEHFTSINKVPNLDSVHAYQLNHNIGVFIKHLTTGGNSWRFTFPPGHQHNVRRLCDIYGPERTFLIFVCGEIGFCIITFGVFAACFDLNHRDNEWFEVYREGGSSFRVRGALGDHKKKVPLSAFPRVLFE